MASKDTTGEKLLASIRQSKTGAVTRKNNGQTAEKSPAKTVKPAASASKTAKATKAKAKPAKKTRALSNTSVKQAVAEKKFHFSHGCRVWPD